MLNVPEEFAPLFSAPDIMSAKKALCIQPHPDDNEVGMGGIVAALTDAGCEVHYLTVTNGDLGALSPQLTGAALAAVRGRELQDAGRLLGVTKFFGFDYPDGSLSDIPRLAGQIAELIRTEKYDAVFCPDPWQPCESHWDHVVTGRAAAQAFISSGLMEFPRGTKTQPCQPFAIGFYFTSGVNTVVDVTGVFDRKFEAMAAHKSQMNDELLGLYRAYFTWRGANLASGKGFALGEGLRVLSPLHCHCFAEAPLI